jgi:hypothetical protein
LQTGFRRRAKRGEYLAFKVDGNWRRAKETIQRPTPWADSIGTYLQSQQLRRDLEERTAKEVQKYIDKGLL